MKTRIQMLLKYGLILSMMIAFSGMISHTAQVWAGQELQKQRHCIIVDAGHGGEDGGAVSCTGVPESKINLEIAVRLNSLLQLLGYETKMIRTIDVSVYTEGKTLAAKKISDLKNRVATVNSTPGAFLLSIHQNNFQSPQYSGAQMFYNRTEEGKQLAHQLQSVYRQWENPKSGRQEKPATGVYLMDHTRCPGVLIECGFLSNSTEEKKLRTPVYQKKLSCMIAATTAQFLDT